jgi:hypothetical protein
MIQNSGRIRDRNIANGSPPEVIARKIMRVLKLKHPASFYAAGKNAALLTFTGRYLPDKIREKLIGNYFNRPKNAIFLKTPLMETNLSSIRGGDLRYYFFTPDTSGI